MKTCTIYNSYSGNTRAIAEYVQNSCGGNLVEVTSKEYSSRLTAYTIGRYRAMKGICDPIEPAAISVASEDIIVIGTPVWAGRATPAINAAVAALEDCQGKPAVVFATCGGKEGDTLRVLHKALEAKGMVVAGTFAFDKAGQKDPARLSELVSAVKAAGNHS